MSNLLATLGVASRSLGVFSQAISIFQNNVGNATTPGFARQRLILEPLPFDPNGGQVGGVSVARVESIRDRFLDLQVVAALQNKTYFDKLSQTVGQIESNFPLAGEQSIGVAIDQFFHSFQALSTSPGDFSLRQVVLQSARQTANTIHSAFTGLTNQRATLDQEAGAVVEKINSLGAEIARLNGARKQAGGGEKSALDTRFTQLLEELGSLVDYQTIQQDDGTVSIVLRGGAALASGTFSYPLRVFATGPRLEIQDSTGQDVSANIQGGQLGAILTARNISIVRYLSDLDQLAGTLADAVNEQLAAGRDLAGAAGKPIFQYTSLAFTGIGRTAGTVGAATPGPPISMTVNFAGGVTGSITANLDSFFVATAPPAGLATGDTITVNFTSADSAIKTSITTAPLTAGDSTAVIAARLNDQIALNPALAGKITFSDQGGNLKIVESDTAGQGFTFTTSTSNLGFTSGLESGGSLGGQSATEIAAALNAQVALNPALAAAGVRFTTSGGPAGQVRVDANVGFTATATDFASGTGFVSGLAGTFTAGGSPAAATFAVTPLGNREIAASGTGSATGNENALAMGRLASAPLVAGASFNQFYGRLVSQVGEDGHQSQGRLETEKQILLEAQNLRDSFSGVSLDEEAAHLVQFQKAYEATGRVIAMINSLLDDVIHLVR